MTPYTTTYPAKPIDSDQLQAELTAAGVVNFGSSYEHEIRRLTLFLADGPPPVATINAVIAAHTGDATAKEAAARANDQANESILFSAQMTTLINNLQAGTASTANAQKAIAFILKKMRRVAGSIS